MIHQKRLKDTVDGVAANFLEPIHGIPSKTFICGFIRRISED